MITRERKLDVIEKIANSYDPRLRLFNRAQRRERARFCVDHAAELYNSDMTLTRQQIRGRVLAAFDAEYGSALLMFLAFQLIWWFIEKYLLD